VRVAWILEEDRRVTIPVPNRGASSFNLVIPVFAEQEGSNVVRRTRAALKITTSSLHAPLPYECCRIHSRKRVVS
jgi:hypothetical protein